MGPLSPVKRRPPAPPSTVLFGSGREQLRRPKKRPAKYAPESEIQAPHGYEDEDDAVSSVGKQAEMRQRVPTQSDITRRRVPRAASASRPAGDQNSAHRQAARPPREDAGLTVRIERRSGRAPAPNAARKAGARGRARARRPPPLSPRGGRRGCPFPITMAASVIGASTRRLLSPKEHGFLDAAPAPRPGREDSMACETRGGEVRPERVRNVELREAICPAES